MIENSSKLIQEIDKILIEILFKKLLLENDLRTEENQILNLQENREKLSD